MRQLTFHSIDSFRPKVLADLPTVTRSESPLSRGEWESFFDVEGRMSDEVEFREKVFRNGVEHDIRPEVWKFLLGYFDGALTHSQRAEYRSKRVSTFCACMYLST